MKFDLSKFSPCEESLIFYTNYNSFEEAWNNCPRGDWMLWIAKKLDVNIQLLTLAKAHCANTVRHLMKDKRSIKAVDIAILFGEGKCTIEELSAAAYAAYYAANATYAAYYAANAAYATSYAAFYAAHAASYAAHAAHATSYAASYAAHAAHAAAKTTNQLETANICRKYLTEEVFKLINNNNYDTKEK